jgi:hypothetical protein
MFTPRLLSRDTSLISHYDVRLFSGHAVYTTYLENSQRLPHNTPRQYFARHAALLNVERNTTVSHATSAWPEGPPPPLLSQPRRRRQPCFQKTHYVTSFTLISHISTTLRLPTFLFSESFQQLALLCLSFHAALPIETLRHISPGQHLIMAVVHAVIHMILLSRLRL